MKVLAIILIVIVVLAILYFLMIMPRMAHKPDTACFKEWLYAHRGLHDNATQAPENSMAAFRKAVDAGFGIELDIQLTKDKIPVVFHDFTLKRVCGGEGKICDYTYEELQQFHLCESTEKIPKFEDVLQMVDGKVPLIVEFKIERTDLSLCPIADKMLRAYKGMYCMESFNPLGVQWYRKNHPELVRGQLSDAFLKEGEYVGVLYFVLQNLLLNFVTKPDFVAYNHHYPEILSRKLCRGLYHNTAAAWTIKSQQELDEARKHFDIFIFDSFVPEARKKRKITQKVGSMIPWKSAFYYMRYARKNHVYESGTETAVTERRTHRKRDDSDPFLHESHRRGGERSGYCAGCLDGIFRGRVIVTSDPYLGECECRASGV